MQRGVSFGKAALVLTAIAPGLFFAVVTGWIDGF